jgi:predicted permease
MNDTRSPTGITTFPFFTYQAYTTIRDAVPNNAVVAYTQPANTTLTRGDDDAIPLTTSYVAPNYFQTLGVHLARGRFFAADEERVEAPALVANISHAFWGRAFAFDSAVVGREAQLGSRRFTIIGVTEPGFSGLDVDAADAFITLSAFNSAAQRGVPWYQGSGNFFHAFGRIPGDDRVTLAKATLAYNRRPQLPMEVRDTMRTILDGPLSLARGPQQQGQEVAISTRVAGVALVVLLIACANMANLMLVRATRRRREVAVRLAIGVSRGRLFGQLLTESLCLAALGGLASLGVAFWGGQFLRKMLLPSVHWAGGVIDIRVIALTGSAALLVGIAGGVAPALQAHRQNVVDGLKTGAREGVYQKSHLRSALLLVQAALSIVLIAGAGLFVRSLGNVRAIDLGYAVDSLAFVSAGTARNAQEQQQYHAIIMQLGERMSREPGVIALASSSAEPMRSWGGVAMKLPGRDSLPRISGPEQFAQYLAVSPQFFSTVGMRIVAGREFAENEPANAVIVNEKMAQVYWPGQNAIGQCIIFMASETDPCTYVVGVTENAHKWRIVEEPNMQYFRPTTEGSVLVLRIDPARWPTIAARALTELKSLVPRVPSNAVVRMSDRFENELRPWRTGASLFTAFGILALVVAAIGIYSVIAYGVSHRIHEMGVRIALGARARDVISLVIGDGMRVVVLGVLIGLGITLALGHFVASLLYGVTARDPGVMIAAAVTLFIVGIVAALLPAWRASRVDPVTALRAD